MRFIYFIIFFLSFLYSCNSEGLDKPSEDQIVSDLIGNQVEGWQFLNKEEFKDLNIISSNIQSTDPLSFNDDELKFKIKGEFFDYERKAEYSGQIFVTYKLNDKIKWIFKGVEGKISPKYIKNNEITETKKKNSSVFSINYDLKEKSEIWQCNNCSHQFETTTFIEFPILDFDNYENENEIKELWEKHKKKIWDDYFGWNHKMWMISGHCPKCDKGNPNDDFTTVDIKYNQKASTFERN